MSYSAGLEKLWGTKSEDKPWRGIRHVAVTQLPKIKPLKKCLGCPALLKMGKAARSGPCQDEYKEKRDAEYRAKKAAQL